MESTGIDTIEAALPLTGEGMAPMADMVVAGVEASLIGVICGPRLAAAAWLADNEYMDDRLEDMAEGALEEVAEVTDGAVMEKLLGQIMEKRDVLPPSS